MRRAIHVSVLRQTVFISVEFRGESKGTHAMDYTDYIYDSERIAETTC